MKKILSLILLTSSIFLTSQARASKDGFYIAADIIFPDIRYKFDSTSQNIIPNGKAKGNGLGYGFTGGYRQYFGNAFFAPEIFYDYINATAKDSYRTEEPYGSNTLELRSRKGAKLSLGYDFNNLSVYLTYGAASVYHVENFPQLNIKQGRWTTSPISGIGARFNFTDNWAVKAEFTTQKFDVIYAGESEKGKVKLDILKAGIVLKF